MPTLFGAVGMFAGYGLGSLVGAPWLGAMIGATIGGYVDRSVFGGDAKGPRLEQFRIQSSEYGRAIPQLWGAMRMAGNFIWLGEVREDKRKEGEKGNKVTIYRYFATFAIGICRGPVIGIIRMWADGRLIYNVDPTPRVSYVRIKETGEVIELDPSTEDTVTQIDGLDFTVYLGSETQTADPTMEVFEGAGNVPGHRGLAYIVFRDLPLELFGNRIPTFTFEVTTAGELSAPFHPVTSPVSSIWGSDNVVLHPNGVHAIVTASGYWYKVNLYTERVDLYKEHRPGGAPLYADSVGDAAIGVIFDIDENGVIYTTKASSTTPGTHSFVATLSSETLEPLSIQSIEMPPPDADPPFPAPLWHEVRVFKNPEFPWVFLRAPAHLWYFHRVDMASKYGTIEIPGLRAIALDHVGGRIFAVNWDGGVATLFVAEWGEMDDRGTTPPVQSGAFAITIYVSEPRDMTYDPATNQIIIASDSDNKIVFFDAAALGDSDDGFLGEITNADDPDVIGTYTSAFFAQGVVNGHLYFNGGIVSDRILRIDVPNRRIDQTWEIDYGFGIIAFGSGIYHPYTNSVFMSVSTTGANWGKVLLDRLALERVMLSQIVSAIATRAGLTASEIDVTQLTDTVKGYLIDQRMPARNAIEPLALAYFFDAVESDGKVYFPKGGGASVVTIPESDLAAHIAGSARPQELISTRTMDVEIPSQIEVTYLNRDLDYDPAIQRARRLVTASQEKAAIGLPIVLDDDEALQIAEKGLYLAWMQRTSHRLHLPRAYSYLNPADVITVSEGGATHVLRIDSLHLHGGVIDVEAVNEDASLYESDAVGVPTPRHPDIIEFPGPTKIVMMDVPLLRSVDDSPGIYLATAGYLLYWNGAQVYKSLNGGGSWEAFFAASRDAVIGTVSDSLGNVADPFVWDDGNTVTVWMFDPGDVLVDATELEVLNGANAAVIGEEVIGFRTATLNADGSYTLSGLLRGRRGSDFATGSHANGEAFVLLDPDLIHFAAVSVEEKNFDATFRAVSIGMQFDSGMNVAQAIGIRNKMPIAPQHIGGTRDASNNLTIAWIRRTRFGGEWSDGGDVPLGETAESYEVDIYDGSTLLRTITAATQVATYTAVQQSADGITPGGPVDVEIYQLSSVVGRGFASDRVTL